MRRVLVPAALLLAACGAERSGSPAEEAAAGPTWFRDVSPLVDRECAQCHVDGGIAPFPLETYEDAVDMAPLLAHVTAERTMPPWGVDNSGACNTFVDARWLTDDEIALFQRWLDAGAPAGDPADAPAPAEQQGGLTRVDASVDMGVAYTPRGELSDDYRCFVVDPGLATKKYLTAFEVKPGRTETVHHIILYSLDDADTEASAVALDDAEPGPGYTCFGSAEVDGSSRFIAGWAPGTPVTRYPEGTGVELKANRKLVMQVHYNTLNGLFADRSAIDLELSDDAKPAHIIPVADFDFEAPPGQADFVTTEEWDLASFGVPISLTVHGVFPHMHTLGTTLRVELEHEGATSCLVDVPRWDFHWQQFYFYERPLLVGPTDKVRIACGYDTTSRDAPVTWGEGTMDEMCLNFLYVTVAD